MVSAHKVSGRRLPFIFILMLFWTLVSCGPAEVTPAPPKASESAPVPVATSQLLVPIDVPLDELQQLLNANVPQTLFAIDQEQPDCIPPRRITVCLQHEEPCEGEECRDVPCRIGVKRRAITPALSCRLVGEARRGAISLTGRGQTLYLAMPLNAEIEARDVGNIISKTATAEADVRADVQLRMTKEWQPGARLSISYDWKKRPGTRFAGRRFTFAGQTDRALEPVIADLERDIPRQLAGLGLQQELQSVWEQAFAVIEVNARDPAVWLRITPSSLGYGGYAVVGRQLRVMLQLEAGVETFIGHRPDPPEPLPLPDASPIRSKTGFRIIAPVIADYAELQPVLKRALDRLTEEPIAVPAVGQVKAKFGQPRIYASTQGRLAIGLSIKAESRRIGWPVEGLVWLTGVPKNAENSPVLEVHELTVTGTTNRRSTDLLLKIALSPDVINSLETALRQDFSRDLDSLRLKIEAAIAELPVGDFTLHASLDDMRFGTVQPLAQGAYLPVEIHGSARLVRAGR